MLTISHSQVSGKTLRILGVFRVSALAKAIKSSAATVVVKTGLSETVKSCAIPSTEINNLHAELFLKIFFSSDFFQN